jgi:hypothetical protein
VLVISQSCKSDYRIQNSFAAYYTVNELGVSEEYGGKI